MIAGTLPRSISARDKCRDHLRPEGRIGVGGHEPDEVAAMREKSAREIVDLIAEGVGGRLHARQRCRRDAGAGREGARDGGPGNAGAFGDVARADEPAVALFASDRPSLRPNLAGHSPQRLHNRVAQLCNYTTTR